MWLQGKKFVFITESCLTCKFLPALWQGILGEQGKMAPHNVKGMIAETTILFQLHDSPKTGSSNNSWTAVTQNKLNGKSQSWEGMPAIKMSLLY